MKIIAILLKSLIFYPMLWFRVVVRILFRILFLVGLLGGIVSVIGIVGKLFPGITGPAAWELLLITFGMSFIGFMLQMLYDTILLKLNPTGNILILS